MSTFKSDDRTRQRKHNEIMDFLFETMRCPENDLAKRLKAAEMIQKKLENAQENMLLGEKRDNIQIVVDYGENEVET